MTKSRVLAALLILAPAAAFATNRCDFVDCLAEDRAKAAAQAAKLKAQHDFQVRVDAAIAKTDELLKTAQAANAKAQQLELGIDGQIRDLDVRSTGRLNGDARMILLKRTTGLRVVRGNIETYDRALLVSIGSLQQIQDLLPFAHLTPDQFWRIEGDLKSAEATISTAVSGVDQQESVLKTL